MSGGPENLVPPARKFGEKIGVAFQLVDDVIDLAAKDSGTGKPPGTDVRRGVTTLPVLYLQELADGGDTEAAALLQRLARGTLGEASDQEFQDSIAQLREHPVTERTMDTARTMADDAIAELSVVPEGIVKEALIRFAHQVVKRSH
jgi:heptaprenyl diphosphate synthase